MEREKKQSLKNNKKVILRDFSDKINPVKMDDLGENFFFKFNTFLYQDIGEIYCVNLSVNFWQFFENFYLNFW
jgi:hypothetical protein